MKRIDMYLTKPQIVALSKISKRAGLSVSALIRRAIDKYIEKQK
jgi:hypothetical protein